MELISFLVVLAVMAINVCLLTYLLTYSMVQSPS